jgi:hypothetical protein
MFARIERVEKGDKRIVQMGADVGIPPEKCFDDED